MQIENKHLSVGNLLSQWLPSHAVEYYTVKKADGAFLYDISVKSKEGNTLCTFFKLRGRDFYPHIAGRKHRSSCDLWRGNQ